jgi:hypothetical protein
MLRGRLLKVPNCFMLLTFRIFRPAETRSNPEKKPKSTPNCQKQKQFQTRNE